MPAGRRGRCRPWPVDRGLGCSMARGAPHPQRKRGGRTRSPRHGQSRRLTDRSDAAPPPRGKPFRPRRGAAAAVQAGQRARPRRHRSWRGSPAPSSPHTTRPPAAEARLVPRPTPEPPPGKRASPATRCPCPHRLARARRGRLAGNRVHGQQSHREEAPRCPPHPAGAGRRPSPPTGPVLRHSDRKKGPRQPNELIRSNSRGRSRSSSRLRWLPGRHEPGWQPLIDWRVSDWQAARRDPESP